MVNCLYKYKCIIFSHEQRLQIMAALKGERHEGSQQADQGCADLGPSSLPPDCLLFIGSLIWLEYVPMFNVHLIRIALMISLHLIAAILTHWAGS